MAHVCLPWGIRHFPYVCMCVSEDIFREKSFFTFAASYTHVGSRPLQIQPLTSKLPLSFPIPEGHLSSHTTLREKEDAEEKKMKAT